MSTPEDEAAPAPLPSITWLRYKRAFEVVRQAVMNDVTVATGESEADLGVLIQISESGGTLRQSAIAADTGWDRTRLSHQLTRLERRNLVIRNRLTNGVDVRLSPEGTTLLASAHPTFESAVQANFIDRLDETDRAALERILHKLLS